ncbi:unnamed protein product [Linum trigynum]|uniref:Uncharacterized protein n=1 Tax=Linum trigynum TaxID=586398 RepID=A0AAV2F7T0_9ROSI
MAAVLRHQLGNEERSNSEMKQKNTNTVVSGGVGFGAELVKLRSEMVGTGFDAASQAQRRDTERPSRRTVPVNRGYHGRNTVRSLQLQAHSSALPGNGSCCSL